MCLPSPQGGYAPWATSRKRGKTEPDSHNYEPDESEVWRMHQAQRHFRDRGRRASFVLLLCTGCPHLFTVVVFSCCWSRVLTKYHVGKVSLFCPSLLHRFSLSVFVFVLVFLLFFPKEKCYRVCFQLFLVSFFFLKSIMVCHCAIICSCCCFPVPEYCLFCRVRVLVVVLLFAFVVVFFVDFLLLCCDLSLLFSSPLVLFSRDERPGFQS